MYINLNVGCLSIAPKASKLIHIVKYPDTWYCISLTTGVFCGLNPIPCFFLLLPFYNILISRAWFSVLLASRMVFHRYCSGCPPCPGCHSPPCIFIFLVGDPCKSSFATGILGGAHIQTILVIMIIIRIMIIIIILIIYNDNNNSNNDNKYTTAKILL